MSMALHFVATARFEAACRIPMLPDGHPSQGLHGHSYVARVRARPSDGWCGFAGAAAETLAEVLRNSVATLDYADLNQYLPSPTDENLARWLMTRLQDVPGLGAALANVGVQSTAEQGADLDGDDHAHIWRRFRFEAAHQLPNVPVGHPCGRMHGHGFEVILHADQDLAGSDMGVDLDHLAQCWAPLQQQLHYHCLNDIAGLENPTSEMLCQWIWRQIKPRLAELSWVTVYETATAGCHYDGHHFRIWKEMRFESALRLQSAPDRDRRRQLHGHSYLLRLHLTAPLDQVRGWTVDYGEIKALFAPIYKALDHRCLNDIPGLADGDVGSVLDWIRHRCRLELPQLDRIDLMQTPGCGAVLSWGEHSPALPS